MQTRVGGGYVGSWLAADGAGARKAPGQVDGVLAFDRCVFCVRVFGGLSQYLNVGRRRKSGLTIDEDFFAWVDGADSMDVLCHGFRVKVVMGVWSAIVVESLRLSSAFSFRFSLEKMR